MERLTDGNQSIWNPHCGEVYSLYEIIRFGGKKDKSQPKQEDQDDETAEDESEHDSESDSPSPMMESKSTLAGSVKLR